MERTIALTRNRKPGSLVGQTVRITNCEQSLPEHLGQIGTVMSHHVQGHEMFRVYLGAGICRARGVELVNNRSQSWVDLL